MKEVWLIGTGNIAIEYAKVLESLCIDYIAIGRGKPNINKFIADTQHDAIEGGIEKFLKLNPEIPTHALVTVNIETLSSTARILLKYGVKNILLEKPGICNPNEIYELAQLTRLMDANVLIAYNRRFYASTLKAQEIIKEDGGVRSFGFEFTEWAHRILPIFDGGDRFKYWFLANSSHVVDLAFYLGGKPTQLNCFTSGGNEWHPSSTIFTGAGVSDSGALFNYHANWEAPGRWFVEICTKNHRLYFKPIETLQIQNIGSIELSHVKLEDEKDKQFKPGLYMQIKCFLENSFFNFCTIDEQKEYIEKIYNKMSGYKI